MEENRHVQYLVTFAVALAGMAGAAAYSWTAPVIPKFHNNETDFTLTDTEISWIVSSVSPGAMIGCLLSRYTSDRFGRRATLLGSAFPFTIGTCFPLFSTCAALLLRDHIRRAAIPLTLLMTTENIKSLKILSVVATKAWHLCCARVFWGLGIGAGIPVAMVYVAEIAAKDIRGKLSVINHYMFLFGSFLVITVGSVVTYQELAYMLVALTICYFSACFWVPETPYFLLKEGKIAAAKKALKKLNGYKDETVLEEKLENMRTHVREEMKRAGTVKELFTGKQYRRAIVISVGLRLTQGMAGTVSVDQYLGRILQETNLGISVSTGMIMFSAMKCTMSIVASFLVDKSGRRPLLIFTYLGASLTFTFLGAIFFFHEVLNKTFDYFGYTTLFGLMLFTAIATLGFDTVCFLLPAEIFPLNVRSTAMTCLVVMSCVNNFVNLRGYQIIKDFSGIYGIFWLYASFSLLGGIFSYLVVPETKGKSLREIQVELQGAFYDEDNEESRKDMKLADMQEMKSVENVDETMSLKV